MGRRIWASGGAVFFAALAMVSACAGAAPVADRSDSSPSPGVRAPEHTAAPTVVATSTTSPADSVAMAPTPRPDTGSEPLNEGDAVRPGLLPHQESMDEFDPIQFAVDRADEGTRFSCDRFTTSTADVAAAWTDPDPPAAQDAHLSEAARGLREDGWTAVSFNESRGLFVAPNTTEFAVLDLANGTTRPTWCEAVVAPPQHLGARWTLDLDPLQVAQLEGDGLRPSAGVIDVRISDTSCPPTDESFFERVVVEARAVGDAVVIGIYLRLPNRPAWMCAPGGGAFHELQIDVSQHLDGSLPIRAIYDATTWIPRAMTGASSDERSNGSADTGFFEQSPDTPVPNLGEVEARSNIPLAVLAPDCPSDDRYGMIGAHEVASVRAYVVRALGLPTDGWVWLSGEPNWLNEDNGRLVRASGGRIVAELTIGGQHDGFNAVVFAGVERLCDDASGPADDTRAIIDRLDPTIDAEDPEERLGQIEEQRELYWSVVDDVVAGTRPEATRFSVALPFEDRCALINETKERLEAAGWRTLDLATSGMHGGTILVFEFSRDTERLTLATETTRQIMQISYDPAPANSNQPSDFPSSGCNPGIASP